MGIQLRNEDVKVYGNYFSLPFHPAFLDPRKNYDPCIAIEAFPDAVKAFRKALPAEIAKLTKDSQAFYQGCWGGSPGLKKRGSYYDAHKYGWMSRIGQEKNGFVTSLCLDLNCSCICLDKGSAFPRSIMIGPDYGNVTLSLEDSLKFAVGKEHKDYSLTRDEKTQEVQGVFVSGYTGHNIDNLGTSLMLRLWGIEYLNRMFEKIKL